MLKNVNLSASVLEYSWYQEFKDVFKLDLFEDDLKQVAISSLKEQHLLQDDEAERYFDMLVEENEISPSDEEVWEQQLKNNENIQLYKS
jgi:hypothetical protein